MKTQMILEVGDRVTVKALEDYAICYNNQFGGTESFPKGTIKKCKIIKTWEDYEIGRRYIGVTIDEQKIYFGEFGVEIKLND